MYIQFLEKLVIGYPALYMQWGHRPPRLWHRKHRRQIEKGCLLEPKTSQSITYRYGICMESYIYIIIYLLCINKYIILYTIYIYIISYIIYLLYIIFIFINQFVGTNIYCIIYLNGIIDKNTCLLFYEFPLRSFPQPRHSLKDQNKETSTSSAH